MARRLTPRPKPVAMRNVLVEFPEDRLLAVLARARDAGVPLHVLVAQIITEWLESE